MIIFHFKFKLWINLILRVLMLDIQISMGILQRATSLFSLNVRKQTAIGLKSGGGAQCGAAATEEGHNGLMDKVYDHLWQCLYYSQWHNNLCS